MIQSSTTLRNRALAARLGNGSTILIEPHWTRVFQIGPHYRSGVWWCWSKLWTRDRGGMLTKWPEGTYLIKGTLNPDPACANPRAK